MPEVNVRVNYPVKKALVELDNNQMIGMSCEIQKFCVSFVTCTVANHRLKIVIISWNAHTIPGIIYFPKLVLVVTTQYYLVISNRPIDISRRYLNFKVWFLKKLLLLNIINVRKEFDTRESPWSVWIMYYGMIRSKLTFF